MQNFKTKYDADLHCHTVRSDGNDTPEELIAKAANLNMAAIAIVDHDISPSQPLILKKLAKKLKMDLIFGYEFSCDTFVDDVHIIGYELDWNNQLVKQEEERAKQSKSDAYKKLCRILAKKGIFIDFESEILTYKDLSGKTCHRNPDEVQKKHIFELMAQKGYFDSWEKAKLFIKYNPELNIKREKINPLLAINIIKGAGGLAVLAHPFLIDEKIQSKDLKCKNRKTYIDKLIKAGLDGIESCYTYNKTSYKGNLTNNQIKEIIETEYKNKVKFFTGGSDYHNDEKKGAKNPRFIGEAGISYKQFKTIFSNYLI